MLGGDQKRQQQLEEYPERIFRQSEDIEVPYSIASILALQGKQPEAKAHLKKFYS